MEKMRRLASGRLSELIGEKTIGIDKFFKTIGIKRSAEKALENLDQESKEIL